MGKQGPVQVNTHLQVLDSSIESPYDSYWLICFVHLSEVDQLDQKDQVDPTDEVPKMLTFQLNGENWTVR